MKSLNLWSVAVVASAAVATAVVCAAVALWLHWVRPAIPFPNGSRLVEIVADEDFGVETAGPVIDALRARPDLFDRVVVYKDNMLLELVGDGVWRSGTVAAHDLLETLGVQPLRGRLFFADEDIPGLGQSIILSEYFWRSRFGGDEELLGNEIEFDSRIGSVTVVGILPGDGVQLPVLGAGADFVVPLGNPGGEAWMSSDVSLLARVAPERSGRDAVDWWRAVSPELLSMVSGDPSLSSEPSAVFELRPFRGVETNAGLLRMLMGLAATAALTLAVGVLNVAVLARLDAIRRAQALSVRLALGAARWRVAFLLLRTSLVPVVIGSAAGTIAARLVLRAIRDAASRNVFFVIPDVSWLAAALAFGVCVVTATVGGLWPLRPVLGLDLTRSLRREPAARSATYDARLSVAVGTQVAVVSALLMVGALFEAAVDRYVTDERGFDLAEVSFGTVELGVSVDVADLGSSMARLLQEPQVASFGITVGDPPLSGWIQGFPRVVRAPGNEDPLPARTWVAPVSAAYAERLGIDLVEGRFFTEEEAARGLAVAVLDTATASALDPGSSLVGRTVDLWADTAWVTVTVIGTVESLVLADTRTRQQLHQVYVPFPFVPTRNYSVLMETRFASSLPTMLQRTLPTASIGSLTRFRDLYRNEARAQLLASRAIATVATLGLVLALVGLFAVVGHATEARRREFGIRQAIGASPYGIVLLSLRSGLMVSTLGLCVGLAGAMLAGRIVRSALLGVAPWDVASIGFTATIVLCSSLAACLRPAVSAGMGDPSELMRAE